MRVMSAPDLMAQHAAQLTLRNPLILLFNVFNTANFGASYIGNGRSTSFKQPNGFIPGSGYPFQLQLGARFNF
jgi:hypothetical protein